MKFSEKYSVVNNEGRNGGMFKGELCKCGVCKDPTEWTDPTFNIYICSDECYKKLWVEYKKHKGVS